MWWSGLDSRQHHHPIVRALESMIPSLDKPHLYHYNCPVTKFLMGYSDRKKSSLQKTQCLLGQC